MKQHCNGTPDRKPLRSVKKCEERGSHREGDIGRVKLTTLLDDHPGRCGW
jgi:hypothetical protein